MVGAEAWAGAEVGAEAGAEVGVTPISSLATSPGYRGQHPTPLNMEQLSHIGDMVTHPMVPTIHPIHLTDGDSY